MSKHFIKVAAAAALAGASTGALATDGNFFVNGEVGVSSYRVSGATDTSGSAYAGRLGYIWHSSGVDFGVEGGYADLGKISDDSYGVRVEGKVHGSLLGANARFPVDNHWFVSMRGGWFHSSAHAYATNGVQTESVDANGDGTYFGIGGGYDFNPQVSLSLNLDNYQSKAEGIFDRRFNTGVYGASFEYRF